MSTDGRETVTASAERDNSVSLKSPEQRTALESLSETELVQSRLLMRSEICAMFQVPPNLICPSEASTFTNAEADAQEWADYIGGYFVPPDFAALVFLMVRRGRIVRGKKGTFTGIGWRGLRKEDEV